VPTPLTHGRAAHGPPLRPQFRESSELLGDFSVGAAVGSGDEGRFSSRGRALASRRRGCPSGPAGSGLLDRPGRAGLERDAGCVCRRPVALEPGVTPAWTGIPSRRLWRQRRRTCLRRGWAARLEVPADQARRSLQKPETAAGRDPRGRRFKSCPRYLGRPSDQGRHWSEGLRHSP
jgi:hypothetical protein